ncbi:bifunctional 4-hydroxy-3-methylbut-2-enyl diphosphate reductase/30S ribosomal protein S1 [Peptoniphilus sp. GNH]|nr:4-hydroxy-3-methylbut-2-enyl diphosphate reductase [Clostridiales bacterium KA00134]UHR03052.1 bifunctional 4-hydroxy-3-methylbut-2-enyl diphosphate reductase/30S ribosomal protein S1 [Peptoniphilus sp. GNH]
MIKKEIILADYAGFCGGVKRAVKLAFDNSDSEKKTYCLGELVHNPFVVEDLIKRNVEIISDYDNIKLSKVILRSHGVHKKIKRLLEDRENEVVDTTCKYVQKIYKLVEEHKNQGYQIVIIGSSVHPEVIGINSYADDEAIIVDNEDDIKKININKKTIVVSQTTNIEEKFEKLTNIIKKISKDEVLVYNTICSATSLRQDAAMELSKKVDAMIVLGGNNSSNTKKLYEVCKKYCKNTFFASSIKELNINLFNKFNKIGITAGASTPDKVIEEAVSSMENFDNNEMMEAIENSFTRIRRGEIVKGEVLFVTDNEVMVNINYRSDGIISREELSKDPDVKPSDICKPGDEIDVYILKVDDGDGNVVLSRKKVESMKVWDDVEQLFNDKKEVEVKVKSVVKGGLIADFEGLQAFIPASHASVRFQKDLSKYVGQNLLCEIIDFDKNKRKIVLSRKNVEERELEENRKKVYSTLKEGDVIEGTVQRLTNFGAFVDVGGVDGLIHISELSWNRVKHPSDVVSPGEKVQVQVLTVDEEKSRIALGLKQTQKRPWDVFVESTNVGDTVKGNVVNLLDFGAFVRLDSGVDGLLHVSQIAKEHIEKPEDVLKIGQEVEAMVTDINNEEQKISLSIKALFEDEEPEVEEPVKEKKPEPKREKPKKEPKPEVATQEDLGTTIGDLFNINLEDNSVE